jgi:hypothetical protein
VGRLTALRDLHLMAHTGAEVPGRRLCRPLLQLTRLTSLRVQQFKQDGAYWESDVSHRVRWAGARVLHTCGHVHGGRCSRHGPAGYVCVEIEASTHTLVLLLLLPLPLRCRWCRWCRCVTVTAGLRAGGAAVGKALQIL